MKRRQTPGLRQRRLSLGRAGGGAIVDGARPTSLATRVRVHPQRPRAIETNRGRLLIE